jgi:hypothetical protein
MPALVITGQVNNSLSEAQWREIKESLSERCVDLDAQTISKLAEIPGVVIVELRDAIEAERAQPTRSEMAKRLTAARESRQFDETDPNMLGLLEPNFSDRQRRTPERVRKRADKAVRDFRRPGKGNKPYYPQPNGLDSATKCAFIISIKFDWPGFKNGQAQAACEALYAAAGGDIKRLGWTPNRAERDGFWRDHMRLARRQWRNHFSSGIMKSALNPVTYC